MTYEERRRRHVADAIALAPAMVERRAWPAERLAEHRTERLRALVRTAADRSPWHRRRLAGVDVGRLTEATLAQLPVMTKADVMTNFDACVTDDRLTLAAVNDHLDHVGRGAYGYLCDRYSAITSGGSSGMRGVFVYDWEAWATFYLSTHRHLLQELDVVAGDTGTQPLLASIGSSHPIHAMAASIRTFAGAYFRRRHFPITEPMPAIVAGLNEAQPALLSGYASALRLLAHEAGAGRLRISPRRVTSASEPLLPDARGALEAAWNVPVGNMWAASEGGGLGTPCVTGATHLSDDLFIVEPVDAGGTPVAPGTRSAKLYLTNLYNQAQPLIRYEVTDAVVELPGPCACGSAHRRIGDIQGRLDDVFFYEGVAVHPEVFDARVGPQPHVLEYQVSQRPDGAALLLRCDGPVDMDAARRGLVDDLHRLGVCGARVTIQQVDEIPRQATGKLKRFIPLDGSVALSPLAQRPQR